MSRRTLVHTRSQQSHLGFSRDGKLVIVKPFHRDKDFVVEYVSRPRGEAFISRLPDELLEEVFGLTVRSEADEYSKKRYASALALSVTCKRFNRISTPLLYQNIILEYPINFVPPQLPVKRLYRTMKANPTLRTLCQRLSIYISDILKPASDDFSLANELLPWFVKVKSLRIHGGFGSPYTWPMLREAFQHMPVIHDLSLSREGWGLFLEPIRSLNLPHLRGLQIHGTGGRGDPAPELAIASLPAKGKEGTATFTKLEISDFGDSPAVLKDFLTWPKTLEHFSFYGLYSNSSHWDFGTFESLLDIHRSSLKTITLGRLCRGGPSFIDLSNLPNVEALHVSAYAVTCSPGTARSKLGPRLHTLGLDYCTEDQHSESWDAFGPTEADWLRKFADIARFSSLRKITISFSPDEWDLYPNMQALKYPWDLMDEVRDAIRPYGISLSYNQPRTSRLEFQRRIEKPGSCGDGNADIRNWM